VLRQRLEIPGVDGRQLCTAPNGHSCNHAIGQTARTPSRLIEKARGQYGVGREERLWVEENLPRECLGSCIQRPAKKFRPGNAADVEGFRRRCPSGELSVLANQRP